LIRSREDKLAIDLIVRIISTLALERELWTLRYWLLLDWIAVFIMRAGLHFAVEHTKRVKVERLSELVVTILFLDTWCSIADDNTVFCPCLNRPSRKRGRRLVVHRSKS
jgi:hypothetical protein